MILAKFFGRKTEKEKTQKEKNGYYDIIDNCAEKKEDFTIRNNVSEHAAYVLKTLFKYAQKEVCLFVGRFNNDIFDNKDLMDAAVNFLKNPDARLKIAYQDPDSILKKRKDLLTVGFLRIILSASTRGKVEIWDARKSSYHINNHFFLNDRYAFRYEMAPRNVVVNFGDKEAGEKLAVVFAKIVAISDKILG